MNFDDLQRRPLRPSCPRQSGRSRCAIHASSENGEVLRPLAQGDRPEQPAAGEDEFQPHEPCHGSRRLVLLPQLGHATDECEDGSRTTDTTAAYSGSSLDTVKGRRRSMAAANAPTPARNSTRSKRPTAGATPRIARTQHLLLHGHLAKAEPKTLRYRLLHVTARLTCGQRRLWLRIQRSWPWLRTWRPRSPGSPRCPSRRLIVHLDTTSGGSYRQNGTPVASPRPSPTTTEQRSTHPVARSAHWPHE
jgi:hypothetical protein